MTLNLAALILFLLAGQGPTQGPVDTLGPGEGPEGARGLRVMYVRTEAEARDLRVRIENGEAFEALAGEYSIDPSAAAGGYLGRFRPGELRSEFNEALSGVAPGSVSPVARVGDSYVLLQLLSDDEDLWMKSTADGVSAFQAGRYPEARLHFRTAAERAETSWGPNDARLVESLRNLATLHLREGRYDRAEPVLRRALAIGEETLGGEHADLLQPLNDLAGALYRLDTRLDEAEMLFTRALGIAEALFGESDTGTATSLSNLALVLRARGQYAGAEPLFRRSLGILESALGPHDPGVALALEDLAELLRLQGRLAEAEAAARRSLEISEGTWGADHPALVDPLGRLAGIQHDLGHYEEAIALYGRALGNRWGAAPGAMPPDVVSVLDAFSNLLEAAPFGSAGTGEALAGYEAALLDTPIAEDLYIAMARLLKRDELYAEAERTLLRAAEAYPRSPGVRYELGETYATALLSEEALETFESIRATYGPTSAVLRRIGDLRRVFFEHEEAFAAYRLALEADPYSLETLLSVADLHFERNELDQASDVYASVLEMDPENVKALSRLADAKLLQGHAGESAALAGRAVEAAPGDGQAHYILARALTGMGRTPEAEAALGRYRSAQEISEAEQHRNFDLVSFRNEAESRLEQGAWADAAGVLRSAVGAYPDAARMYLTLGLAERRLGEPGTALESFLARLALEVPDDFEVHAALGAEYALLGEEDSSLRHRSLYLRSVGEALEAALK